MPLHLSPVSLPLCLQSFYFSVSLRSSVSCPFSTTALLLFMCLTMPFSLCLTSALYTIPMFLHPLLLSQLPPISLSFALLFMYLQLSLPSFFSLPHSSSFIPLSFHPFVSHPFCLFSGLCYHVCSSSNSFFLIFLIFSFLPVLF